MNVITTFFFFIRGEGGNVIPAGIMTYDIPNLESRYHEILLTRSIYDNIV